MGRDIGVRGIGSPGLLRTILAHGNPSEVGGKLMTTCAKCGATLADNANFCVSCGARVGASQTVATGGATGTGIPPNIAALLCYILWPVACILFLVLDPYRRDKFVRFHAYQALYLGLVGAGVAIALSIVTVILGLVIFLMYKAYSGERYWVPGVGKLAAQKAEKLP